MLHIPCGWWLSAQDREQIVSRAAERVVGVKYDPALQTAPAARMPARRFKARSRVDRVNNGPKVADFEQALRKLIGNPRITSTANVSATLENVPAHGRRRGRDGSRGLADVVRREHDAGVDGGRDDALVRCRPGHGQHRSGQRAGSRLPRRRVRFWSITGSAIPPISNRSPHWRASTASC